MRATSEREEIEQELTSHIAGLRRYAYVLIGDPAEADDLVQECLARALATTRPWKQVRDVRAYLFTILHNVHADRRWRFRRAGQSVDLDLVVSGLGYPAPQEKRVEVHDLQRALYKIPEEQRQVLLLVGMEGMSYREAAIALDVPIGTIMSILSRGRTALQARLSGRGEGHLRRVK